MLAQNSSISDSASRMVREPITKLSPPYKVCYGTLTIPASAFRPTPFFTFLFKSPGPLLFVLIITMSMICEIVVTNKFRNTKFFLFQEIPQITNGPSSQIFTTMYQVTDRVEAENDGSSIVEFQMDSNFFAMFGSLRGQGSVARVETSSFRRIRLGPGGSVVALTAVGGGLKWNDAAVVGRQSSNNGSFQFLTDNTIPTNTSE